MLRRTFVLAVATTTAVCRHLRIGKADRDWPIVMGLGDLGAEVVVHLAEEHRRLEAWVWNDRGPSAVVPGPVRLVQVERAVLRDARANIVIPALIAENLGSFSSSRPVRIVVGLGGEIGSGLVYPLTELLEDRTAGVEVLYSIPLGEGERRRRRWNRSLAALTAAGVTARWVNLWHAAECGKGIAQMCRAADPARPIRLFPHAAKAPLSRLRYFRA